MNSLQILIIDLDSPCPTQHCTRLSAMLQRFRAVGEMHLQTTTSFPSTPQTSPPDIILLRLAGEQPSVEALCALRSDWDKTPILGFFCLGRANPCRVFHTLLTGLDDFVSCPFTEIDLFPRVQRLLYGKSRNVLAAILPPARDPVRCEFLVGESRCHRSCTRIRATAKCSVS